VARWTFDEATGAYGKEPTVLDVGDQIFSGAVSGHWCFLGTRKGSVLVVDLNTMTLCQSLLQAHRTTVSSLEVAGECIVSCCIGGYVKTWAPSTNPPPSSGTGTPPVLDPRPQHVFPKVRAT
jgi:hypothetical protein